jgi:CTP:molybdopterin cytidylyltransferase MocA
MRTAAVVLAAGAGTRLGGVAKALLLAPGRSPGAPRVTFLAAILDTAHQVGAVDAVVVVGPPHGDAVAMHARELGARVVVNARPERGMASSVALGFAAISETVGEAAWLWPVDHPAVTAATLRALVDRLGGHEACRPVYAGRGGHPPLVARALWPRLASCAGLDGGARAVLAGADVLDVAVEDPGCVHDIDRPGDLEALA